eukprot:GHVS01083913.1.p1 GENE.GHVS01083913.1~~GHVS01083913.1.p1  ORF type:complete len:108 (-),score=25.63 GHVS01083913.1:1-324(-)
MQASCHLSVNSLALRHVNNPDTHLSNNQAGPVRPRKFLLKMCTSAVRCVRQSTHPNIFREELCLLSKDKQKGLPIPHGSNTTTTTTTTKIVLTNSRRRKSTTTGKMK